jgi:AraC-like DNA-binding protein
MIMPIGPLVWFYVRCLLEPEFRIGQRERWHLLPLLLDCVPALICWTFFIGLLTDVVDRSQLKGWGDIIDQYDMYVDLPRWLSLTLYVFLARQALNNVQPVKKGLVLAQQQLRLPWLRQFLTGLLIFQALWLLFLIPYLLPALRPALFNRVGWYWVYVPITGLIYWFGLMGFVQAQLARFAQPKTASTRLSADEVDTAISRLRKAMEADLLYTDPALTLEKLMQYTHLDQKTLSHVLNQHLAKSFNAFVNEYRIEAVKQRLVDPASKHLTITGVALDCGFNSQATFQRAFKQVTGLSPSNYLAQQTALSLRNTPQL